MSDVGPSRIDHDTRVYWEGLAGGKLALARCNACGQWLHPPKGVCSACWSDDIGHDQPSGEATLFSYLVQPAASGEPATIVGWAELSEQPRLIVVAPILGVLPETVQIGAKLQLEWTGAGEHQQPAFRQAVR